MATRRKPTPSYLLHSASGRARAVWTDQAGIRRDRLLLGEYDSPESRTAFATLLLELVSSPHAPDAKPVGSTGVSVNELMLAFLEFSVTHYVRPDGSQTHEVSQYKLVARYVRELYGDLPACEFGPLALKAVRQKFIEVGWCRSLVNQRVNRIRHMFKWAVGEQLVAPSVHLALAAVGGLLRGRSNVRETAPVEPVADSIVDATLPFLNRHIRGLVEFQRLTGCRPGEACMIRRSEIDTGGAVWMYRPTQHKTAWRGKPRVIAIGPQAQSVLREFFTLNLGDYLFSPRRAVEELHARRSQNRVTPRYPSHMARNVAKRSKEPIRTPAEVYDVTSYGHAIGRACDRAFPPPLSQRENENARVAWWARLTQEQKDQVKTWQKAHRWHPNQLRHSFATRVRKQHGLEAAQVLLGHSRADVTQIYAERNDELAGMIAAKIG